MKTVRSVMIIDDNVGDVEIASYYLKASGRYKYILSASDGVEALRMFKDYEASRKGCPEGFPPLIVLLDINMPRMNGFEFLEAYQALKVSSDEPVVMVMVTSSKFPADIERATQNPLVARYLTKPFDRAHATELADEFGT